MTSSLSLRLPFWLSFPKGICGCPSGCHSRREPASAFASLSVIPAGNLRLPFPSNHPLPSHFPRPATAPSPASESPTKPHILLIVDQFPKSLGGGERIVLRLASLLPRYGYRVSILTFLIHPQSPIVDNPPDCPVYVLPILRTYDLQAIKAAIELSRFLRKQEVRIVQTFFESSDIWAGFVTRIASRAKLIWSRRDMGILRTRKHHTAYRLLARFPHKVFAVSEQVRRHAIEVDRIDPARVETIYNGLDLAHWNTAPTPRLDGRIHLTTIGNIRHVKGHDIFLRAAAIVVKSFPQTTISIAGEVLEPAFFAQLQDLIQTLGLERHVTFTGGITDLPRHLQTADIFVLPSRSEGFSNSIIEAMAAGLPVVATDVGGNAEAVLDAITGFIVPTEDPTALAAAILRLLADPTAAQTMGAAGRRRVHERFTTEAMMQRTVAAYASLLS